MTKFDFDDCMDGLDYSEKVLSQKLVHKTTTDSLLAENRLVHVLKTVSEHLTPPFLQIHMLIYAIPHVAC